LESPEEPLGDQLDRLEAAVVARDAELRRLKTEFELRTLYMHELQSTIEAQARRLEQLEQLVKQIEEARQAPPTDVKKPR
jgi:hypothetical protein